MKEKIGIATIGIILIIAILVILQITNKTSEETLKNNENIKLTISRYRSFVGEDDSTNNPQKFYVNEYSNDYLGSIDYTYDRVIKLENVSDKSIRDVKIKICFEAVSFYAQMYNGLEKQSEFGCADYIRGYGGYATLIKEYDVIRPDEEIELPIIPFDYAMNIEPTKNQKVRIEVYGSDIPKTTYEYDLAFIEKNEEKTLQ